jgi:hypothetical protein
MICRSPYQAAMSHCVVVRRFVGHVQQRLRRSMLFVTELSWSGRKQLMPMYGINDAKPLRCNGRFWLSPSPPRMGEGDN